MSSKNVVMMRVLQAVIASPDWGSAPAMFIGQSMVGWVPEIPGMMARFKPPTASVDTFMATAEERTKKIIRKVGPSRDTTLDIEAEKKTKEEMKRGVLLGPFSTLEEIDMQCVSVVPRNAVWEQHGTATERSVRCIDDMLTGEPKLYGWDTVQPSADRCGWLCGPIEDGCGQVPNTEDQGFH